MSFIFVEVLVQHSGGCIEELLLGRYSSTVLKASVTKFSYPCKIIYIVYIMYVYKTVSHSPVFVAHTFYPLNLRATFSVFQAIL